MTVSEPPTVACLVDLLERRFPPAWAESWDRVGLVVGEPDAQVRRVLLVVDCMPETVEQAVEVDAQLIVSHHPLLLRGVSSVAATSYKGRLIHRMIRAGIALYTAHTNADVAYPGVSDALADRIGLLDQRPLRQVGDDPRRGFGRIGRLPTTMTLAAFTQRVAAVLPATAWGVRAAGPPQRPVSTVAVCGGAGDSFFADAMAAGVDAYLTADLRHHPASEFISEDGPALLDAAHWATERLWLDPLAAYLTGAAPIATIVSDLDTDPWTVHAPSGGAEPRKEPHT